MHEFDRDDGCGRGNERTSTAAPADGFAKKVMQLSVMFPAYDDEVVASHLMAARDDVEGAVVTLSKLEWHQSTELPAGDLPDEMKEDARQAARTQVHATERLETIVGHVVARTDHATCPLYCFIVLVASSTSKTYAPGALVRPIPEDRFRIRLNEKGHFWKKTSRVPQEADLVEIRFLPEHNRDYLATDHGRYPHRNEDLLCVSLKLLGGQGMAGRKSAGGHLAGGGAEMKKAKTEGDSAAAEVTRRGGEGPRRGDTVDGYARAEDRTPASVLAARNGKSRGGRKAAGKGKSSKAEEQQVSGTTERILPEASAGPAAAVAPSITGDTDHLPPSFGRNRRACKLLAGIATKDIFEVWPWRKGLRRFRSTPDHLAEWSQQHKTIWFVPAGAKRLPSVILHRVGPKNDVRFTHRNSITNKISVGISIGTRRMDDLPVTAAAWGAARSGERLTQLNRQFAALLADKTREVILVLGLARAERKGLKGFNRLEDCAQWCRGRDASEFEEYCQIMLIGVLHFPSSIIERGDT
eukprot:g11699.t1